MRQAREALPELPHRPRRAHWSVLDPADGGGYARFECVADDIETRVRHLVPVLATATEVTP